MVINLSTYFLPTVATIEKRTYGIAIYNAQITITNFGGRWFASASSKKAVETRTHAWVETPKPPTRRQMQNSLNASSVEMHSTDVVETTFDKRCRQEFGHR